MATKGTKKELLHKMEERILTNVSGLLEKFRNSVNDATEINMKRILSSLHASSAVIDSQTDRLNALAQLLLANGVCDEEQLKEAILQQREARLEASREYLEEAKRRAEEAKEAKKEVAAPPMLEEDVVLGAAEENVPFTQPTGSHPVEADIFGG